jgi:hypothetical protein
MAYKKPNNVGYVGCVDLRIAQKVASRLNRMNRYRLHRAHVRFTRHLPFTSRIYAFYYTFIVFIAQIGALLVLYLVNRAYGFIVFHFPPENVVVFPTSITDTSHRSPSPVGDSIE